MAKRIGKRRRDQVDRVRSVLAELYPDAHCALDFADPLQLLVATILSAQCTDKRVNIVTPALFARFPDARAFADADLAEVETLVQSTGFFRAKANNIVGCCRLLVERHGGEVPARQSDLVALPGVGRKTANVVLGNAFGIPGITVDTHVGRVSRRLGLTEHDDPVKVEFELMALVPPAEWTIFSHRMIFHGRQICASQRPKCGVCPMGEFCPVGMKAMKSSSETG